MFVPEQHDHEQGREQARAGAEEGRQQRPGRVAQHRLRFLARLDGGQFQARAPNQCWLAAITYLATYEGVETLYGRIQTAGRPVAAIAINAGVGVSGDFSRDTDPDAELHLPVG